MLELYVRLQNYLEAEDGQTLTEYALILVLIAIVVIAALTLMGTRIDAIFDQIVTALT
jgi:pilus assembly protein Flp/PilA